MHESIVRSEKEIKDYISNLAALADNKDVEVAKLNLILYEALMGFYINRLNPQDIITNQLPNYSELAKSTKLIVDMCLWLTGKFNTPPTYNPLKEEQFSAQQVLEDFGNTNYTEFTIS